MPAFNVGLSSKALGIFPVSLAISFRFFISFADHLTDQFT